MDTNKFLRTDFSRLARPLVTLAGLVVFILNYCLFPIIFRIFGKDSSPFHIPSEVILGYFGFISIYSAGRSFEKAKELLTIKKEDK